MIIDGRQIAKNILTEIKAEAGKLPFQPVFCDVLVGNNPVSASYVRIKGRKAQEAGIGFKFSQFAEKISQADLIDGIRQLNQHPNMCGLIVQLPLPAHLDRRAVLDAIDPALDVDCMGSANVKKFYAGEKIFVPPTAAAIMAILDFLRLKLEEKNILVVGQGDLVGKPAAFLLRQRGLSVNIADINTKNTDELLKEADVVISATGKAGLITGGKIKPGAAVIDAGTSESDGGIAGDADFESVSKTAGFLSPVPGGVGPVTVSMLLGNVVLAAKNKK